MKIAILIIGFFISAGTFAQNVLLKKGQQITITTNTTQNTEMTMGMTMKGNSTTINRLDVLESNEKNYTVSNTLTKMLLNSEMMGQQVNYDSDKKEDKESEIGKSMDNSINKARKLTVNKTTGDAILESPDSSSQGKEKNPMEAMMGAMGGGNDAATASSAFFIIPNNKKAGDKWIDSSTIQGIKTVNIYTLESIAKNIATIISNTIIRGNTTMEAQGTQLNVTMNTTATGKIIVDKSSSLVKSRATNASINSSIDVMGQTMDVSGTATTTSTYQ